MENSKNSTAAINTSNFDLEISIESLEIIKGVRLGGLHVRIAGGEAVTNQFNDARLTAGAAILSTIANLLVEEVKMATDTKKNA